jgi:tyrosinase
MAARIAGSTEMSRRQFLGATGAAIAAASGPVAALAQGPKYRRLNVTDPQAGRVLESYKKAIRAMLALPPSDPRNWYRNALVHTLDCPHGNWWFLVWHRGYIGWFEQTCRELSGDPTFALPYWDWTATPRVPAVMFEDLLTPTDRAFVGTLDEFKKTFRDVVANAPYWKRSDPFDPNSQYGQLLNRGIRFPDDLWFDIGDDPRGLMFFDLAHARGLTKDKPELDARTTKAVSLPTLLDALAPRDFITFGSPKTFFHSGLTGFGVLEGQPHNRVHNNVGGIITTTGPDGKPVTTFGQGFMQANLSPVDPLFFLHHSNIDRLWDVWTRKQEARGYPILPSGYPAQPGASVPPGSDYAIWSSEPFVFFVDAKGQPVAKTTAGDYAAIGDFNYDYQPGSGEQVVALPMVAAAPPAAAQVQRFAAQVTRTTASAARPAMAQVALPPAALQAGAAPDAQKLVAKITVSLPALQHGADLAVVVNAPGDAASITAASPHFAGTLSMFGHHSMQGPVTFTIPLSASVAALRASDRLSASAPLDIAVVPSAAATPHAAMALAAARGTSPGQATADVLAVEVEAH